MSRFWNRKRWGGLALLMASVFVIVSGGYEIAMSQRGTINAMLGIQTAEITYSDDAAYDYFGGVYQQGAYTGDYDDLVQRFNAVAEEVESEGMVLLRNQNNALPLAEGEKVSTVLSGSYNFNYATSGSGGASTAGYTNLKEALETAGLIVNEDTWNYYAGVSMRDAKLINDAPFSAMSDSVKSSIEGTTAIAVISRSAGEGSDMPSNRSDGHDGSYLSLSENELSVLDGLTQLKKQGKVNKIIVILNTSATIQLDFLDGLTTAKGSTYDIDVDACLWVGNVGSAGIRAVAGALVGQYVPSGKLTDTYAKDNFASPAAMQLLYNNVGKKTAKRFAQSYVGYQDAGLKESNMYYGVYSEGIYVGYRYFETRYYDSVIGRENTGDYNYDDDVAYSFGYGLSYTDFAFSDFAVAQNQDGSGYDVSVTVTNTGDTYAGKEVVEVFLQKPYTAYDIANGVEKAAVELVGYAKTETLAPGQSQRVVVSVSKEQFKSYDAENAKTYIVDDGDYYFAVGNGAHDAVNNILAFQRENEQNAAVDQSKMVGSGNAALAGKVAFAHSGETFAVSTKEAGLKKAVSIHKNANGEYAEITNLLDDANPNKYLDRNVVTFVSRSDWQGTMPHETITITAAEVYEGLQSNKPIAERSDAQMPAYGKDNGMQLAMLRGKAYNDDDWDKLLDQMSFGEQSYLISCGYYQTVVTTSVGLPATNASDGPTGVGTSLGGLSFPSEGIWAATYNDALMEKLGEIFAEESLANGKQNLYAPGVNIHRIAFGGRSHEYFSEDAFLTGMMAGSELRGMQSQGVVATVKHFVFNDEEDQRAGISVWLNEQEAREIMLRAFEYALSPDYGNGASVMNSFNRAGTTWVGAYSGLMGIMSSEWGFNGFCITDMAAGPAGDYMTFQDGIPAGTNIFLGSGDETTLSAFADSATFCEAMREACHKILYTICNYSAAMNNISPDDMVGASSWWWSNAFIGADIAAAVLAAAFVALWIASVAKSCKVKKNTL